MALRDWPVREGDRGWLVPWGSALSAFWFGLGLVFGGLVAVGIQGYGPKGLWIVVLASGGIFALAASLIRVQQLRGSAKEEVA